MKGQKTTGKTNKQTQTNKCVSSHQLSLSKFTEERKAGGRDKRSPHSLSLFTIILGVLFGRGGLMTLEEVLCYKSSAVLREEVRLGQLTRWDLFLLSCLSHPALGCASSTWKALMSFINWGPASPISIFLPPGTALPSSTYIPRWFHLLWLLSKCKHGERGFYNCILEFILIGIWFEWAGWGGGGKYPDLRERRSSV